VSLLRKESALQPEAAYKQESIDQHALTCPSVHLVARGFSSILMNRGKLAKK
jgi:hypothetical protein